MIFLITGCNSGNDVKYQNIRYQEIAEDEGKLHTVWACITFYDKGSYSLYDCDSEPTSYPFDDEWECTYTYKDNKIKFNCKENTDSSIEVLNWDEDTFEFKYNEEVRTFKSVSWIENNIEEDE